MATAKIPDRRRRLPALGLFCCLAVSILPAQTSGDAERDGRDALQSAVRSEVDRVTQVLERLQFVREDLAASTAREEAAARAALDRAAAMRVALDQTQAGTAAVDRLFDEAVAEIVRARARLREAIVDRTAPSAAPHFESRVDLDSLRGSTVAPQVARLEALIGEAARLEKDTRRLEMDFRRTLFRGRWDAVLRLNEVRVRTLNRMSAERRTRVLGFSREGIAQFRREVDHLGLTARAYTVRRGQQLLDQRQRLRDVFSLGAWSWVAIKVVAVFLLFGWLRRRGPALHRSARAMILERSPRVATRRRLEALLATARHASPWVLWMLTLRALAWALGLAARLTEFQVSYGILQLHALYRLTIELLVSGLAVLTGPDAHAPDSRLRHSVRSVLRAALFAAVLLLVTSRSVGQGYLFHVALRLTWLLIALVLFRMVFHWRKEIVDAYLQRGSESSLARTVRHSRDRWYGGLVAGAALVVLAGRALVVIATRFLMGLDQTRRALAFLFRRRVEKQAERLGYARPDPTGRLTPALQQALSEDPVGDSGLRIDYFPGLEQLDEALQTWKDSETGGSFLLTGDYGIGRTSWLGRAVIDGVPVHRVTFEQRIDSAAKLGSVLGKAIELGELDDETLGDKLISLPRRVIVIDRGQNLFLGSVGGYDGFESFMSLVDNTASRVFWLVSFSKLAWEHVSAVHPQLAGFRHHLALEPWPEEKIRELIQHRVKAAGIEVDYSDLMTESLDRVSRRARAVETEEGYSRMLWDHCMGLPRVALNYWRRSLVPDSSSRVRVRLFVPPPVERIEQAGDIALFLLGAITVHESLSIPEMSVVTRYPERLCRIYAARLRDLGAIHRDGERHWVATFWQPAVARLLERYNMVSD